MRAGFLSKEAIRLTLTFLPDCKEGTGQAPPREAWATSVTGRGSAPRYSAVNFHLGWRLGGTPRPEARSILGLLGPHYQRQREGRGHWALNKAQGSKDREKRPFQTVLSASPKPSLTLCYMVPRRALVWMTCPDSSSYVVCILFKWPFQIRTCIFICTYMRKRDECFIILYKALMLTSHFIKTLHLLIISPVYKTQENAQPVPRAPLLRPPLNVKWGTTIKFLLELTIVVRSAS